MTSGKKRSNPGIALGDHGKRLACLPPAERQFADAVYHVWSACHLGWPSSGFTWLYLSSTYGLKSMADVPFGRRT